MRARLGQRVEWTNGEGFTCRGTVLDRTQEPDGSVTLKVVDRGGYTWGISEVEARAIDA